MKSEHRQRQFVYFPILVLAIFFCPFCGNCLAQEFKPIHPGVDYARVDRKIGTDPVKINLLRLDLTKVRLDVHHAFERAIGVEPTSAIAIRNRAVAAINAGFFRLDKSEFAGDAAGILQIDGELLSESHDNRVAIGITNEASRTQIIFGHPKTTVLAGFGTDSEFVFDGVNRERKGNEIVLFTPGFQRTTGTDSSGTEIVLTECRMREKVRWCKNAMAAENGGNSVIPPSGLVISIGKDAIDKSNGALAFAKRTDYSPPSGLESTFRIVRNTKLADSSRPLAENYEDVTNGVPQLIKNGKIDITWEREKASKSFAEMRHPRTAVAKLKDGKFLMITVDGRQPGVSVGMNLQELAEYLLSIGATDAMNLDGGGSTTMFLDGKVVNTPSDKEGERKVGDAIVVTPRKNARR